MKQWDVAVIGGGPAGMMAAGAAAEKGAKVVLLEKNPSLGKKLLITGGGRCNVTNAEFDTRALLAKYGDSGKYLFSPFSLWGVKNTIDFFESAGMQTKVEAEKRVFPRSDSAHSVHNVLTSYLRAGKVAIHLRAPVARLSARGGLVRCAVLESGEEIQAKSFIVAAGGLSRPETGSSGDAFKWLSHLGHTISTSNAALVPIAVHDEWVKRLAGVSLKKVRATLMQDGEKQSSIEGKLLFTHAGLSGPAILNMSRDIGELLQYGDVALELDLSPNVGYEKVNMDLQEAITKNGTKKIRNSLKDMIPAALVAVLLERSHIDPDKNCNSVTRTERIRLMKSMKHLPVSVKGLLGLDKAVVTSGGVSLDELETKTMRSRLFQNLYLAGDVLDINRPSGGYSLQLCWTTGRVAGISAAQA